MKDKIVLKILCYLTFLISGYFTYLAYLNGSTLLEDKIISGLIALCTQGGCFIFFVAIRKSRNTIYAILAVGLFLLSIYATADYQAKKEDTDFQTNLVNSDEYNQSKLQKEIALDNRSIAIADKKVLESNMNSIRIDIADTKAKYKKQTDSLILERNKLSVKMTWRKKQIDKEISNLNKEMNTIITNKENTLESKSNQFKGINTTVNLNSYNVDNEVLEKISSSSLGIVNRLHVWFGWDEKLVSLLKQIIFAIVLEFLAVCLHIKLSEEDSTQLSSIPRKLEKPLHARDTQDSKIIKAPVTQVKKADLKIVKCSPQPVRKEKIDILQSEEAKKYIDKMYETAKDGIYPLGYKTISKKCDVPAEKVGRKVMNYLEQIKVIEVGNGPTKILKDRGEVAI